MNKLIIIGSAKLQTRIRFWKKFWKKNGYDVVNFPHKISKSEFLKVYPQVHKKFFGDLELVNIAFVMNEDRNNIKGYIGAESFAELAYAVAQNLVRKQNIKIILLQAPGKEVQSYDEIVLWLKLGWINLLTENN